MLQSMTGFGEGVCQGGPVKAGVLVRSINNRHLKVSVRCSETHSVLEGDVERLVRAAMHRGTVHVGVRVARLTGLPNCDINEAVLEGYWRRLRNVQRRLRCPDTVRLGELLALPGVIREEEADPEAGRADWAVVEAATRQALDALNGMRAEEGRAMTDEMADFARSLTQNLDAVEERAPAVADDYRTRLKDRLQTLLGDADLELDQHDILREVAMFAERCDVREEIVRLRSHVEQFAQALQSDGPAGRKLEFLTQEMFREANTIGSKANDVAIAHRIVEIKSVVDRMRELIQNVE